MEIKTLRQNSPTFVMKIFDNKRWRINWRRKRWDRPIRFGSEPDLLLLDAEISIVIINHLSSVKTYCNWYMRHEVNKRDFLSVIQTTKVKWDFNFIIWTLRRMNQLFKEQNNYVCVFIIRYICHCLSTTLDHLIERRIFRYIEKLVKRVGLQYSTCT